MKQWEKVEWRQLLSRYQLQAHKIHAFSKKHVYNIGKINHVRLTILPDGGISRMKLLGKIIKANN